ncbi:MAG: hypothetical protein HQ464_00005 [Planctomycetes bacterium]|nr:hypothetical protein [Planctomycetota bacterium]
MDAIIDMARPDLEDGRHIFASPRALMGESRERANESDSKQQVLRTRDRIVRSNTELIHSLLARLL